MSARDRITDCNTALNCLSCLYGAYEFKDDEEKFEEDVRYSLQMLRTWMGKK